MDNITKRETFDDIIYKISKLTKHYNFTPQIVGSFALYLHNVMDISDVHDLDIAIYTSPSNIKRVVNLFKTFQTVSDNQEYYSNTNNACNMNAKRISINIHGVDVCIFVCTDTQELEKYNKNPSKFISEELGNLNYKDTVVKPLDEILKVKLSMGRDKDNKHILRIAKKIFPSLMKNPLSRVLLKN